MKKDDQKFKKEILELESKIADLTAGWQRTQADFINYKKQVAEDRAALIKTANSDLIEELLPVLDNFALAAKHLPENLANDNWARGVQQVEKQFESILLQNGLERISTDNCEFNPELHEAIEEVESDKESGTVVDEISAGYIYNNMIIRPAKVKVAK